jgi:hypothetical protein
MLSKDLAPLQPVDAACRGGSEACRTALDQAATVARQVGSDLQHTPAEPDAIREPVEAIRAAVRFVRSIDDAFDGGTMSVGEATDAYMAEYRTMEHALQQVLAAH